MATSIIGLRVTFEVCNDFIFTCKRNCSVHRQFLYKVDAGSFWLRGSKRKRLFEDNFAQDLWEIHDIKDPYPCIGNESTA